MRRFLLAVALGVLAPAFAATTPAPTTHTEYRVAFGGGGVVGPWKRSQADACEATEVQTEVNRQMVSLGWKSGTTAWQTAGLCKIMTAGNDGALGPNGDMNIVSREVTDTDPTPTDDLATMCSSNAAAKNSRKVFGQTGGSAPDTTCLAIDPPFVGEETKGCLMNVGDSVVVPKADGTRHWSSGNARYTGGTCTIANDPVLGEPKPSKEDKCPGGFEGLVNGVSKCVPAVPDSGVKGIKITGEDTPNGDHVVIKETTTCEGVNCTTRRETTTTTAAGAVSMTAGTTQSTLAEKCQADPQNDVCLKTGTGRGAAAATRGTGSGAGGSGQGNCGTTKTEGCYVNINEDGLENDKDKKPDGIKAAEDAADKAKVDSEELRTKIAGDTDKGFFEPLRELFWAPPIAGCEPYVFPNNIGTLDPCAVVDGVRTLMAFVWAASGLFMCIGMIKRAI